MTVGPLLATCQATHSLEIHAFIPTAMPCTETWGRRRITHAAQDAVMSKQSQAKNIVTVALAENVSVLIDPKGTKPMSERVALCRSSADIPMESVELCLHVDAPAGGWSGEPFRPLDYPFWMTRSDAKPKWNNGEFNIFAFVPGYAPKVEPSPVVTEEPIDWTRFLSADFVGEDINDAEVTSTGYRLAAGTVFLSCGSRGTSVRQMMDPSNWGSGATVLLGGADKWMSTNCRIIRHPDGTWAPGYGPDGPIEVGSHVHHTIGGGPCSVCKLKPSEFWPDGPIGTVPVTVEQLTGGSIVLTAGSEVRAGQLVSLGTDARLSRPAPTLAINPSTSLVAAIPDLPRDHHAPLKHLVPRWRTPRYEAPGRWRK